MRVTILGGTGFIGSNLAHKLALEGYDVEVLTRNPHICPITFNHPKIFCSPWNGFSDADLTPFVEGADVVVNLIGESIATKRWTSTRKREILQSRVIATTALANAISMAYRKPKIVIQGSAVGFYGYEYLGADLADEFSEKGNGFLADVCQKWEDSILPIEDLVERLIIVRTGVVLGNGGFLTRLMQPFKLGVGGRIGDGLQPFSWIHRDDVAYSIIWIINNSTARGVFNLVSPEYACYLDFVKAFGSVLHRPTVFYTPTFALKSLFGEEMTNEVLLGGREVVPRRLKEFGYVFKYPNLEDALNSIVTGDV